MHMGCGGKPTKTWGEHADSTQTAVRPGNQFLFPHQRHNEVTSIEHLQYIK